MTCDVSRIYFTSFSRLRLTNLARDLYCAYVCTIKDKLRTVLQAIILSQWRNINWWLLEVSENNRKSSVVAPSRIYINGVYVDMVDVVKMLMIEYTTHDFFSFLHSKSDITPIYVERNWNIWFTYSISRISYGAPAWVKNEFLYFWTECWIDISII